jgi:copper chaperone CopZ
MKKLLVILCFLPFSAMAKEVKVEVKGMHCGGCEDMVEEALEGVPGVTAVKADAKSGMATLQVKDGVTLDESVVKKAVSSAGKSYSAVKISQ